MADRIRRRRRRVSNDPAARVIALETRYPALRTNVVDWMDFAEAARSHSSGRSARRKLRSAVNNASPGPGSTRARRRPAVRPSARIAFQLRLHLDRQSRTGVSDNLDHLYLCHARISCGPCSRWNRQINSRCCGCNCIGSMPSAASPCPLFRYRPRIEVGDRQKRLARTMPKRGCPFLEHVAGHIPRSLNLRAQGPHWADVKTSYETY